MKNKVVFCSTFFVFIICSLFPNIPVYISGTPVKLYWVIFILFLFVLISKVDKIRLDKNHIKLLMFIIYAFFILFFNDLNLNDYANSLIPMTWYDMNSVNVDSFYRSLLISGFQVLNFCIFFICFLFFSNFSNENNQTKLNDILFLSLLFQLIISSYQIYVLGYNRAYGSLDNPQALGLYSVLVSCVFFPSARFKVLDLIFCFLIVLVTYLSGTKSAMFVLFVILFIVMFPYFKKTIFIYSALLFNIFFAVILSYDKDIIDLILLWLSQFTNTFSLYLRYILWHSFNEVISNNLLFGVRGTTVHFSENIIWFFILSYGVLGFSLFMNFFISMIEFAQKNKTSIFLLLTVFTIQGFSYYGVMIGSTGVIFWSLLGIQYGMSKNEGE
ncbi:hypothetical protein [Aliivibrio sifiae]|uniref:Uncharacterized protein n=1 Tax=Aliivibrio sifiae TaxID=566293 RepID=A0A2S7X5C6_9GAMM|nr:hypothetical protein [Aliivibrio sifiae]PQJ85406.1 hypothetical protein BTO23_18985 [Aliivibrio sifiae]GLR76416.1 hypothetical protein GCM10007855_32910 [Aliivibrio sifiae]